MAEINSLFVKIGRLQGVLVWGFLIGFVLYGQQFVALWAGPEFQETYAATVILMLGLSVSLTQNLAVSILQAKNKMGFRTIVFTVMAVLDLVISVPVSAMFGVCGCATVTGVILLVGTGPIMNVYYERVIGIDVREFLRNVSRLLLPLVSASVVCLAVSLVVLIDSWFALFVHCLFFCSVYFVCLWFMFFNEYEKGLVTAVVKKVGVK